MATIRDNFAVEITNFVNKTQGKVAAVYKKSVMDLFSSVVYSTPVLTGRARANWMVSISEPIRATRENKSKTGAMVVNEIRSVLNFVKANSQAGYPAMFLSNSLPYISHLEYGWYEPDPVRGTWMVPYGGKGYEIRSSGGFSKQAPQGMVRMNVERWPDMVLNHTISVESGGSWSV